MIERVNLLLTKQPNMTKQTTKRNDVLTTWITAWQVDLQASVINAHTLRFHKMQDYPTLYKQMQATQITYLVN